MRYQRNLRVWRFGSEDAAGPAGEDASAPLREVRSLDG
jgi:hypothetical protein